MAIKPRLFGNKKPDGPNLGRIERTLATLPKPQPRQRQHRAAVYREVSVEYNSGYRRNGIVLDYSASGVRLRFPTNEHLPLVVTLHAGAVGLDGQARVVWQHGSEVGLALIPDTAA